MYRISQRTIFCAAALCFALCIALLPHATHAAQKATPGDDDTPVAANVINVTLLGPMFRVQGLQMEDRLRVLALIGQANPAEIHINVCPATTHETIAVFRADLDRVFAGPIEMNTLPVQAVECTWRSAKGPGRST